MKGVKTYSYKGKKVIAPTETILKFNGTFS